MKTDREDKVSFHLPGKFWDRIDQLVATGVYGETPADVLRYLVQRGLDDLLRAGVLKRKP